jgi:hypothetical protein
MSADFGALLFLYASTIIGSSLGSNSANEFLVRGSNPFQFVVNPILFAVLLLVPVFQHSAGRARLVYTTGVFVALGLYIRQLYFVYFDAGPDYLTAVQAVAGFHSAFSGTACFVATRTASYLHSDPKPNPSFRSTVGWVLAMFVAFAVASGIPTWPKAYPPSVYYLNLVRMTASLRFAMLTSARSPVFTQWVESLSPPSV